MRTLSFLVLLVMMVGVVGSVQAATVTGKVEGDQSPDQVVVYVEGLPGNYPPPVKSPDLTHINLAFSPTVLALVKGTTVAFPNQDPVFHSAYSTSKSNPFDLGLYGQGRGKSVAFKNPGIVEISCHIHAKMKATLFVLDNPFSTIPTKDGSFTLRDLPKGSFRITAARDASVKETKPITIKGNETISMNFTLKKQK